jgi:hypothetical protein
MGLSAHCEVAAEQTFTFCSCCVLFAEVEWGELSFKIVRLEKAGQEVLARAGNFLVARAAFDTSVSLWPNAEIELRQGARVDHGENNTRLLV